MDIFLELTQWLPKTIVVTKNFIPHTYNTHYNIPTNSIPGGGKKNWGEKIRLYTNTKSIMSLGESRIKSVGLVLNKITI